MALLHWGLVVYFSVLVAANVHLNPGKDPVLQRLEIPAYEITGDSFLSINEAKIKAKSDEELKRFWGIPDTTAKAGKLFDLVLPKDAFHGHVSRYEVSGRDGKPLPPWLIFDPATSTIRGEPSIQDVGPWTVQVEAIGTNPEHIARDVFTIEVVDPSDCKHLTLSLMLDLDVRSLSTKNETKLKRTLSRILHTSQAATEIRNARDDQPADWVRTGLGNTMRASRSHLVQLRTRLGCNTNDDHAFWSHWKDICTNGQLAKKLGAPILGWQLAESRSIDRRLKRDIEGSGDDNDYNEYDDDEDIEGKIDPESRVVPSLSSPVFEVSPTPVLESTRTVASPQAFTTPASIPVRSTRVSASPITDTVLEPTPVLSMPSKTVTPVAPSAEDSSTPEAVEPTPFIPLTSLNPLLPEIDVSENEVHDYDEEQGPPTPPRVNQRLPRITATAGKVFRFVIPVDTFIDIDGNTRKLDLELLSSDGKNLGDVLWIGFDAEKQEMYGLPVAEDIGKWNFTIVARNSANLSVSELAEIQVRQHQAERTFHHKFRLQIEPEFSEEELAFPRAHWMLKIVRGLSKVIGDKSEDSVVVREVEGVLKNGDSFMFSWSNESLSKTRCPEDEIQDIYEKLYSKENDEVTAALDEELVPQLSVTQVEIDLEGICKPLPTIPPSVTEIPAPGRAPNPNMPPTIPNPVDQLEAQVGVLFRYQVPEDTFHDEEDGNTRSLTLNLLNITRDPLNPKSWLQFDVPNQEFYGLPLESDLGTEEYQLRCTDRGGLSTFDGLVVVVKERPKNEEPVVEFSLKIDSDFESLTTSAHRKARLVDALANLFGDADTRNIVIRSFKPGSVNVVWTNGTLHGSLCPQDTILNLRRIIIDDEGKLTQHCVDILTAADFIPESAAVVPLGVCVGEFTPTHGPEVIDNKEVADEKSEGSSSWTDEYLLTFIVPGIIITIMLLLAAVIACVLYRRRRTGKLGLEERRGFVSKGIPIIFAEELEERPSGRHPAKAPVILKVMPHEEEKPAQPPPGYHKVRPSSTSPHSPHKGPEHRDLLRSPSEEADDEPAGLYQPPPPVSSATSGRNTRPKATSAYRKPPPYVPP